jgi:hypothetical protein
MSPLIGKKLFSHMGFLELGGLENNWTLKIEDVAELCRSKGELGRSPLIEQKFFFAYDFFGDGWLGKSLDFEN